MSNFSDRVRFYREMHECSLFEAQAAVKKQGKLERLNNIVRRVEEMDVGRDRSILTAILAELILDAEAV